MISLKNDRMNIIAPIESITPAAQPHSQTAQSTRRRPAQYAAETWDLMQHLFARFNDHQAHCVIQLDAPIDVECLKRAVDQFIVIFPLLACRFVERPGHAYWEDAHFTAEDIVVIKHSDEVDQEVQRIICMKTDEFRGPQLRINVVRNGPRDTLCIVINHMLCDGTGFKELLYLFSFLYSQPSEDATLKHTHYPAARHTLQVLRTFSVRQKLGIVAEKYDLSRHDNSLTLGLAGDRSTPFIVTRTLSRERFVALRAYAKQQGASVNDLILAAYMQALDKFLGGQPVAIQCILDLRKYLPGEKTDRFCNLTSNLACAIDPAPGEAFEDTLMKVKQKMDAEKASRSCLNLILLLEIVFRALPYPVAKHLVRKHYKNPPFAMSNIGIIEHSRLSFAGLHVTAAYMTGSIKYNPYIQLAVSTFDDEPTLSVAFHGTQNDRQKIEQLLEETDNALPYVDHT
jgi:NRPS condensation-like uncharacterized protein